MEEVTSNALEIEDENINAATSQPLTMADKLAALRQEWTSEIESLNEQLKSLPTVDKLLNVVYTKRQKAVDLYYATMGVLNKQLRAYKQQYANIYNTLKLGGNNIRYTNESAINTQIEAQLIEQKAVIDELKLFTDFMWETVKSIDGIQFAVSNKIKIHEILNGLKF